MRIIYEPRGRALEYAPLAVSMYHGCPHGCVYCFAPASIKAERDSFLKPYVRKDALKLLELDARDLEAAGDQREILMSFTTDPYQPLEHSMNATRQAMRILIQHGLKFTILTKAGKRSIVDLDLMLAAPHLCRYGTTLVFANGIEEKIWEPGAATTDDRIACLKVMKERGIRTWVSLEPVIYPAATLELINRTHKFVDEYRIGKFNHTDDNEFLNRFIKETGYICPTDQEWIRFVLDAKELLDETHSRYIFKEDLMPYIESAGICVKKICDKSPWMCDLPFELMERECQDEIWEDEKRGHCEMDDPTGEQGEPDK